MKQITLNDIAEELIEMNQRLNQLDSFLELIEDEEDEKNINTKMER